MNRFYKIILLTLMLAFGIGCVYFNTFYHTRKAFNTAEKKRKEGGRQVSVRSLSSYYKKAIEKSEKILEKYPNSGWYDDALYISGVSYFYIEDYNRAEKRFRELQVNYPETEYIKESRLYLAKSKLHMGNVAEAMTLFEKLFTESEDKSAKSEAAMTLGEYYFENKKYKNAQEYFNYIIDSLGTNDEKREAQIYIADGYYSRFRYKQALENYLKILDLDPDSKERYTAIYQAGDCLYFLNDIEQGLAYFQELADDPFYYDSLGPIKLRIAEGYEYDGDLLLAEGTYEEIALENPSKPAGAIADFNLGLIYQYDYEDYKKAKEHYDKAKAAGNRSGIYQEALQRSTDIGKLEEYARKSSLDSANTQEEIDSAAIAQYQLAELYLFKLDKPDSAFNEFMFIIDNFPESYFVPKVMMSVALLQRDQYDDTLAYDSILREILNSYPKSDFIPDVIDLLGLVGTVADTGYALYYYKKAEEFAFEEEDLDSADYYYGYVADSFPNSSLNHMARYARLWLTEEYNSPGDSSLYYAYVELADSFPYTELGNFIDRKLQVKQRDIRQEYERRDRQDSADFANMDQPDFDSAGTGEEKYVSPEEKYFIDPDGIVIQEVEKGPIRVDKEFRYPPAAYNSNYEGVLYFQLKLDAFGEINDHRLMNPSPSQELNREVEEVILSSHFDTGWMDPGEYNTWFVYKYTIHLPASLK